MKKVLLIMPAPLDKKGFINVLPPIGILSLASFLKTKGIKTDVFDQNIQKTDKIHFSDYLLAGLSINCANKSQGISLAKKIKEQFPAIKIVIGGPETTANPLDYIGLPYIDFVVVGEGEQPLYSLVQGIQPQKIKGVYYKKITGRPVFTGRGNFINVDKLPFPAFDKDNVNKYYSPIKKRRRISSIITSRGCPHQCIFCFNHLGKKWRAQSPERVVAEIEWQKEKFGIQEFIVYDDNFALDSKRAEKICDLIINKRLNIKFQFQNGLRCDNLTKELLIKMKKAGCWLIAIAPETGNPETLKKIRKNAKLEKFQEVVKWCKEIGIATYSFFMLGFPWESKKELLETIQFAVKLDTDLVQFSRVTPFPNTVLADLTAENNKKDSDINLFSGSNKFKLKDINETEFNKLIKQAYRQFYLRPKKLMKLAKLLKIKDILNLGWFSLKSKNM